MDTDETLAQSSEKIIISPLQTNPISKTNSTLCEVLQEFIEDHLNSTPPQYSHFEPWTLMNLLDYLKFLNITLTP
jgi:hypothetical protein